MSIKIMSAVWENGPEDRGELLVLLALSDFASDKGQCWPSVASIAKKARMDERSARRILRKLEAGGWVSSSIGGGRHGCSEYTINPDNVTPGQNVPTPDKMRQKPGQNEPKTRTPVSPEPSGTIKEPPTARERLLDAMGVGGDGVSNPSQFIGGTIDMAEAGRWSQMGLSVSQQIEVIREVRERQQRKHPGWRPGSFRYFTPAMQRLVSARRQPVESQTAAQIEKWKRMAAG
jgi:hypothetical protein